MLIQQVVNGILLGGVYVLVAIAFSICWGILNVLNFTVPALFMLGGFGTWVLLAKGIPVWAALPAILLLAAAVSCLVERVSFRRQREAGPLLPLVGSLAFLILIENVVLAIWGSDGRAIVGISVDANARAGGVVVGLPHLAGLLLALVTAGGLHLLLARTRFGRGTRAVAESPLTATVLGVAVDGIVVRIFALAGLFSALAGVVFALSYLQVSPFIGDQVALKGLSAMVLGGMGNLWGAVIGGLLIGLVEVGAIQMLSADFVNVIVFGLLLACLVVRPQGLLGDATLHEEKL